MAGARQAVRSIDLRAHRGCHMRMGALDVCPFVPLAGESEAAAVRAAHQLGARLAEELELPVYVYGLAARRSERRVLGHVRNLEFEQLRERVGSDPALGPDYGPHRLHPSAGAVAVGARHILVAYNIVLTTGDVALARRIARDVRASDGGIQGVQARGFLLEASGQAQVSMNLLGPRHPSLVEVFDRVVAMAQRSGVDVAKSELVGLAPRAVLTAAAAAHVRLRGYDPAAQVLEERLAACGL